MLDGRVPAEHAAGHALVNDDLVVLEPDEVERRAYQPTRRAASPRITSDGQRRTSSTPPNPRSTRAGAASATVVGHVGCRDRARACAAGRVGREGFGVGRGAAVDLEHVDDDDGDVVLAAGVVRGVDERSAAALRVGLAAREALDVALAHHRGEAVGAEQDAVAGRDVERVQVDVDVGVDAERAR